jgi:hypothetical protein
MQWRTEFLVLDDKEPNRALEMYETVRCELTLCI